MSMGEIVFFISGVILGYLSFENFCYLNVGLTVFMFVLYIVLSILDNSYQEEIALLKRLQTVCNNEIAYLDNDFSSFYAGDKYIDTQHEYSYDLDLFGKTHYLTVLTELSLKGYRYIS